MKRTYDIMLIWYHTTWIWYRINLYDIMCMISYKINMISYDFDIICTFVWYVQMISYPCHMTSCVYNRICTYPMKWTYDIIDLDQWYHMFMISYSLCMILSQWFHGWQWYHISFRHIMLGNTRSCVRRARHTTAKAGHTTRSALGKWPQEWG
jgi:hypothetical protein